MPNSKKVPSVASGRLAWLDATVLSAGALSLALLGDALLNLILPTMYTDFGLTVVWVGVILSINRFIRLGANYLVIPIAQRTGLRRVAFIGVSLAVIATTGYGVVTGLVLFIVFRLSWGLAYAFLRMSTLGYATRDKTQMGRQLGISSSVIEIGPFLLLIASASLIGWLGVRPLFIVLGVLTALAFGLVAYLPPDEYREKKSRSFRLPRSEDGFVFVSTFAAEGIFRVTVVSMWLSAGLSTAEALQYGGLLLAGRRLTKVLLSPVAGNLADRWGMTRLFYGSGLLILGGFITVSLGIYLGGSLAIIIGVGGVMTLAPGVAVQRMPEFRLLAVASVSTWRDMGAAVGALIGPVAVVSLGVQSLYLGVAVIIAIGIVFDFSQRRKWDGLGSAS